MYKVYYDDGFYITIANFSNYLKEYYFKLYTDTGIIDENIILNSYDESVNLLQKQIFDNIETFCETGLLGRIVLNKIEDYEEGYFFIKINTYQIKIDFNLDKKFKEAIIKGAKINT